LVIAFSVFYDITRFFEYRHETYEVPTEVRSCFIEIIAKVFFLVGSDVLFK